MRISCERLLYVNEFHELHELGKQLKTMNSLLLVVCALSGILNSCEVLERSKKTICIN